MHDFVSFVFKRAALSVLACALIVCCVLKCTGPKITCWTDVALQEQSVCKRECLQESFSLAHSDVCHPKLSCRDIKEDVHVQRLLARGVVKNVYRYVDDNLVLHDSGTPTATIQKAFTGNANGLSFTREDPSAEGLQFLDVCLVATQGGTCWRFQQRSQKPYCLSQATTQRQ
ncbi:protein O-mannose kinase [Ixodes scapularis]